MIEHRSIEGWLPAGKRAAVCLSIDDVHPSSSPFGYDAGGDLERGVLGRVARLLERHPRLAITLFVTADWRARSIRRTRRLLDRVPVLREHVYHSRPRPAGTFRLDRHPSFVDAVRALPRCEVALHGLHHLARGPDMMREFGRLGTEACRRRLRRAIDIFERAGLPWTPGLQPPVWDLSPSLARACADLGLRFVASARDLDSGVAAGALAAGSGLRGVPLLAPARLLPYDLVHFTTNFQATSGAERAFAIVEAGGLLSIKAHATKILPGHVVLDGLDREYAAALDRLFGELDRRYGDELWWTTLDGVARRIASAHGHGAGDEVAERARARAS